MNDSRPAVFDWSSTAFVTQVEPIWTAPIYRNWLQNRSTKLTVAVDTSDDHPVPEFDTEAARLSAVLTDLLMLIIDHAGELGRTD